MTTPAGGVPRPLGDATDSRPRRRARRSDALANQEKVLAAAVTAMRRHGEQVALHTIASEAGVGTATLYRSYPDRRALLVALGRRAYDLTIAQLEGAVDRGGPVLPAIEAILDWHVEHRDDMVLPLHDGPLLVDEASRTRRRRISDAWTTLLERGRHEGVLRGDVTSIDMIFFCAWITRRMPNVPDWDVVARRQQRVFLDGLTTAAPAAMPASSPSIEEIRAGFGDYWR